MHVSRIIKVDATSPSGQKCARDQSYWFMIVASPILRWPLVGIMNTVCFLGLTSLHSSYFADDDTKHIVGMNLKTISLTRGC